MPFTKTFNPGEILTAADANEFLLNQGYQYRETIYFTSSGDFEKADYPWLRAVRVRCVGGGGGGGGANANGAAAGGSGGGYAERFFTDIAALDASVTVTRGAGGAGGAAGDNNGAAGDESSFGGSGDAWRTRAEGGGFGGRAGDPRPNPFFNAAGIGLDGDLLIAGNGGGVGRLGLNTSTGNAPSGFGGGSVFGGGAEALRGDFNDGGRPGRAFGGGGSGGVANTGGGARAGGAGANGIVIVDLYA